MRIERLENSKHKQERVLVYLEDGTLLRITGAELLQFGLYHGLRPHAVQKGTDGAPDEKGRFTG